MTDELKDKFQQLVADPPPPTAVPSEAVFAKVRTVRRRRTAGVAVLAAAAVVAIAVAGNSLTDINSSPPISNKPNGATTVIAPPPSNTASTTTPSTSQQTQRPPAVPPIGVAVTLTPRLTGRSLTMKVTMKGTLISPLGIDGATSTELPADTDFLNRSLGTDYTYGDGEQSGSDGGAVTCTGAKKRVTSQQTYTLLDGPHVYKTAGTYTFSYTVKYCGAKGQSLQATKTARIVVR